MASRDPTSGMELFEKKEEDASSSTQAGTARDGASVGRRAGQSAPLVGEGS